MLGLTALAGIVAGFGCSMFCADCDCGDGPWQMTGTVATADRAELVGAKVSVYSGSVSITWTQDEKSWSTEYSASVAE